MSDRKIIKGSIWYHERMTLPPNAEIHIFLEDIARMLSRQENSGIYGEGRTWPSFKKFRLITNVAATAFSGSYFPLINMNLPGQLKSRQTI